MAVPDTEALALQRRASALFRAGDADAGIPAYQALLAARPDLPNSWFNLAILQRRARRFDDALASYGRALELGIDRPEEVHLQRGVIHADDLAHSAAARVELHAALALNPDYVPALLNLGNLHEDCGERAEARAAYARALRLDPANALALARAAGVADPADVADPLLVGLQAVLDAPSSTPNDRADVGFALGAALDRLGAYDRAFAAYAAANRQARIAGGGRYDPRAQEMLVDRLIAAFPQATRPQTTSGAPIFICGMFRSGSTLVERMLARHSGVVAGGELNVVPALIQSTLRPYPQSAEFLTEQAVDALRSHYLAAVAGRHPADTALTDKRPDNFLHIGLIKTIFPDARIVHTVRQPLDNCLSIYFLHADPALSYATDLKDIAHYQRQQDRVMKHWRQLYPDIVEVDYDRLVATPQETLKALLAALDLPWEDAALDHRIDGAAIRTASHWQARQPLYQLSSGRWRNYAAHLGILADRSGADDMNEKHDD